MSDETEVKEFDEQFYLATYPDIAAAVARGEWPSGYVHYCQVGKGEGRQGRTAQRETADIIPRPGPRAAAEFDEVWYSQSYPVAVDEVRAGKVRDFRDHFFRFGRHRGYLPRATAQRPENSALTQSRFGGFWTDQANALDLIAGRLALGRIAAAQAALLEKWVSDGYVILKNAIPEGTLRRAEADLNSAFHGEKPELKFDVTGVGTNVAWIPQALTEPAKLHDFHWLSRSIRDLIFSDCVLDFLHLVFERRVLATQTLGFWRGSAQDCHQDSAYVNYSHPMQFAATWIALEDVAAGAGELCYYAGSHRMPEFLYLGQFKGISDARRIDPESSLDRDLERHVTKIAEQAHAMGLSKETLIANRGDVLVWSADLAHGGSPISRDRTRKSVVTHYCPAEAVPSYFENRSVNKIRSHDGVAYYTSSHYSFDPK